MAEVHGDPNAHAEGHAPTPAQEHFPERVRTYIDQKVQQIRETFNRDKQEYKTKFNELRKDVEKVSESIKDGYEPSGDPISETPDSGKNIQLQAGIWSQTTLDMVNKMDEASYKNFVQEMKLNKVSEVFLRNLSHRLSSLPYNSDDPGITYLYKLANKAINSTNQLFSLLDDKEFKALYQLNTPLYTQIIHSIAQTAGDREIHLDKTQIGRFMARRMQKDSGITDDAESSGRRGDYGEAAFLAQFGSLMNKEGDEAHRALLLYEAIKTPDPLVFDKYLTDIAKEQEITDKVQALQHERRQRGLPEFTDKELNIAARKEATIKVHETLEYIVNQIYATTLSQHPHHEWRSTVSEQGKAFANPDRIYKEAIESKLIALTDASKDFEAKEPHAAHELKFFAYKRKEHEFYDEDLKRMRKTQMPTAELQDVHPSHFAESLKEFVSVEKGALEFGFNLMYIIHHPPEEGLFEALKKFAADNIKTETIDNLYIFPRNEIIQGGVMTLESMYKRYFSGVDWRKVPEVEAEFLEHLTPAELATQNHMNEVFREQDVPQWAINRAFYHARLMSFGKEFMFQMLSSYADPILDETGKPTFLSEGVFARNSTFDVWDAAKRWGPSTDPYLYGMPTMPWDGFIKNFFGVEIQQEGEGRWRDSFTHGKMSYFTNEIFRKFNPMISRHNITRMGGMDAYGGWRMKYSYSHWLNKIWNVRERSLNLGDETNDKLMVEGWKSIENIGTNVLRHYVDNMIADGVTQKDFKDNKVKYEQMFKFLHKRYFTEGLGKSMYEGTGMEDADEFWKKISNEILNTDKKYMTKSTVTDLLRSHMYNALTVVLSERMPTEFIFMEKVRSTQNGVTLQQELLEEFVHPVAPDPIEGEPPPVPPPSPWAKPGEDESDRIKYWKAALDDIMYVQEEERMRSIREMKKAVQMAAEKGDPNEFGVLYGDLQQDTSSINYKIDRRVVEQLLRKRYKVENNGHNTHGHEENHNAHADEAHGHGGHDAGHEHGVDGEGRVKRALELYDSLMRKIESKPAEGMLEKKWRAGQLQSLVQNKSDKNKWDWETNEIKPIKQDVIDNESNPKLKAEMQKERNKQLKDLAEAKKKGAELAEKAKASLKKRGNLFSEYWKDWEWGMQFTADTAGQFMNRAATGEETIARTAGACSDVAESLKKYITGGDWIDGMNGVIRKGRDKWDELHSGILGVYSKIKNEDGDRAKEQARNLANWSIMALRRDDRARGGGARLSFQIERKRTSVAAVKVGEGPAADLDGSDVYDFMLGFSEKAVLAQFTPESGKNYKRVEVEGNLIQRAIAKVQGNQVINNKIIKYVRDYSGEISAQSVRKLHKGSRTEVAWEKGVPILGIASALAVFLIVRKALDEASKG